MIRAFKLADIVAVFLNANKPPVSKAVQYVNIEADANTWRGWEFEETDRGLVITPPWKGDQALVPWAHVKFIQRRPEAAPEPKKPAK